MARIAYWDCFSGISGDMSLGALVDAGLPVERLRVELERLGVPGWEIAAEREVRYGVAGTRLRVHTAPQPAHRHLPEIEALLDTSSLDDDVRQRARAVFRRLAEAEGAVHGMHPDEVHFHEVGALDAIVDIVGVVLGLKLLGVASVYASALPLGSGWIDAAHGRIPVPGPAVLALLGAVDAPLLPDDTPFELVTPTGAALLAELAVFRRPAFKLDATGYGFGSRDTGRLNAVRVWLGEEPELSAEPAWPSDSPHRDQVVLLETNIDDQPGEQIAFAVEQLLARGALDAWWQPIGMKKGRAGVLLSVLLPAAREDELVELLFRETSSLGIRRRTLDRWVCDREIRSASTPWGPVRVKVKRWRGEILGTAPEYEDCARIARENDVPLQQVFAAVQRATGEQDDGSNRQDTKDAKNDS